MSIYQDEPVVLVGTLAELANYTVSVMPIGYLYFARDAGPNGTFYVVDIVGSVRSWKAIGGSGASGSSPLFIFTPGGVQSGNVYSNWAQMMAAIATLPLGALPIVRFVPQIGGPNTFAIPLAGMPVAGWDMVLGSWESFTFATGSFVVTIPDGVRIANLATIQNGLQVEAAPTTDYGVFNYNTGLPWILAVGLGAKLVNLSPGGVAGLIVTPGTLTVPVVYVQNQATIAIPPASTGPIVKSSGTDSIIGVQQNAGGLGGLPDGWIEGTGSSLQYQNGIDSTIPLIPGWTGPTPTIFQAAKATNLEYTPAVPANWTPAPTQAASALDQLAAKIAASPGVATFVYTNDPGLVGPGVYTVWADLYAVWITVVGPKQILLYAAPDGGNNPTQLHLPAPSPVGGWVIGVNASIGSLQAVGNPTATLVIDDGAGTNIVKDLYDIGPNVALLNEETGTNILQWTAPSPGSGISTTVTLRLGERSQLTNNNGLIQHFVTWPAGAVLRVEVGLNALLDSNIFQADGDVEVFLLDGRLARDCFDSGAGTVTIQVYDGSYDPVQFTPPQNLGQFPNTVVRSRPRANIQTATLVSPGAPNPLLGAFPWYGSFEWQALNGSEIIRVDPSGANTIAIRLPRASENLGQTVILKSVSAAPVAIVGVVDPDDQEINTFSAPSTGPYFLPATPYASARFTSDGQYWFLS